MKLALNYLLRALCLLAYAMALAKLADLLPAGVFDRAPLIAFVLLVLHAAETVFMFKQVRLYRGALAVSILLTLLFGLLHWMPLAVEQKRAGGRQGHAALRQAKLPGTDEGR